MNKEKLQKFVGLLIYWQQKFNLISKNSLPDIWERHIEDCLQIKQYITKKNAHILDIGSGAGLPGIVLAINDPYNFYTLVESNSKKVFFLQQVVQQLKLNEKVTILNQRVEHISPACNFDYVTARAFSSLTNLSKLCEGLLALDGVAIFPKGASYQHEIEEFKTNNLLKKFAVFLKSNKLNLESKIIFLKKRSDDN